MRNLSSTVSALLVLLLTGCVVKTSDSGPAQHESRSIPLDKAERVRAELRMGAGTLKIRGGAEQLMNADFIYNVPAWKPEVRYDTTGFRGRLTIEQPSGNHRSFSNSRYEWDLQFNDNVPLSLDVQFGAGNAELNLGSISLERLEVKMGVGNIRLDLKGSPKNDYEVTLHGGVGNATVYLPSNVGVVAQAHGGLGSVNVSGLHKRGDRYVNEAYENNAKVNVRLEIQGGIGSVHLIGD